MPVTAMNTAPREPKGTHSTAATNDINITKPQQQELRHLSDLLHLLHHRNKNQHRRSTWYRHFSTFRRQLSSLLADVSALHTVPATHLERSRKRKRDAEVKSAVSVRLAAWKDVYVEKWHLAFSQLVADGRFAALGLVLVGVLAGVCGVVGVTGMLEWEGEERVREAIERFGREEEGMVGGGLGARAEGASGEDVGVAVRREGEGDEGEGGIGALKRIRSTDQPANLLDTGVDARHADEPLPPAEKTSPALRKDAVNSAVKRASSTASTEAAKKVRKRKKGDAIDDLFSGLG